MVDVNIGAESQAPAGGSVIPQESPVVPEEAAGTPKAGAKTAPNLLLKSLQDEREQRRIAEARVQELEESITSSVSSDTGDEDLSVIKSEVADLKRRLQKSDVLEAYPELKDKWADFEEFRADPENKGMNMKTAAKSFLVEKGLIETKRQGLEKPTGGTRAPLSSGMSVDEVKTLRETNYKKYVELLGKGQIKIA